MQVIERYLYEETYDAVKRDFGFLINRIKLSGFEYDLQIRKNYLNLYYKGNSIGKISYLEAKNQYKIQICDKFVNGLDSMLERFNKSNKKRYSLFAVEPERLRSFFSVNNLRSMGEKVKEVNFQEEIVFEQMLITDNVNRDDLIIIDRQIMDRSNRTKMDLLSLKRNDAGKYQFCILEVKLGNNAELKDDVFSQLNGYIARIEENFSDYKKCYEENVKQKKGLGLLPDYIKIDIVEGILGYVVVGGYSGLAKQSIEELKSRHPDTKVLHIENAINLGQAK